MAEVSSQELGIHEGDVIAGKYRVDRILGVGGMGVVVAAHHMKLDQHVAIKLLLPEALGDSDAVIRFEREARAAARIKSEHIVRVMDVGTLENGAPYMVMEYLEGEDLAARLEAGPLPVERAVEIALQTCEVLAEAHRLGVIHRDLKPANLFCLHRPTGFVSIKVLDFGISKVTNFKGTAPGTRVTKTSAVMGTPTYMSPEQMQSPREVDHRTDIWAMGVILYELLAGRVPFDGQTYAEICIKVATLPTPSLRRFRPDVMPGLEAIIAKCLQKNPHDRFDDVAEFAIALAPFGPKRAHVSIERISLALSSTSRPSAPSGEAPGTRARVMTSWWRTVRSFARRSKVNVPITVAAAGIAGLSAGWLIHSAPALSTRPASSIAPDLPRSAPAATSTEHAKPRATDVDRTPEVRSFLLPSALPIAPDTPPNAPQVSRTGSRGDAAISVGAVADASKAAAPTANCTLSFNSIPVSSVAVDGEEVGLTPKLGIVTSPGEHVVAFDHAGYGTVERRVTCKAGETRTVSVRFENPIPPGPIPPLPPALGPREIEMNPYR